MKDPKDTPPPTRVETREERLERRRRERAEQVAYKLEQEIAVWDPTSQTNITADPFKTLFIARIVSIVFMHNTKQGNQVNVCVIGANLVWCTQLKHHDVTNASYILAILLHIFLVKQFLEPIYYANYQKNI